MAPASHATRLATGGCEAGALRATLPACSSPPPHTDRRSSRSRAYGAPSLRRAGEPRKLHVRALPRRRTRNGELLAAAAGPARPQDRLDLLPADRLRRHVAAQL